MTSTQTRQSGSLSSATTSRKEISFSSPVVSVLSFIALMGAIPALAHDNAGLNFQYMPWTCLLLLLAVPALLSEFPRWSRLVQVPMIIMVVLLPISFIFAPIKSDFPATILTFTGMFLVAAAASQLWHYSKKLLLALLSITAIAYFVQGIFTWMVVLAPGQERLWRSLGWHNPSAAFFGALALIPLAAALATSSTKLRLFYASLVGVGFSIVYLTGSRGGWLCLIAALAVLAYLLRPSFKAILVSALPAIIALVLTTAIFTAIAPAPRHGGATPFGTTTASATAPAVGRAASDTASGNFSQRLLFWKTAIKITEHYPLLGVGPGSWIDVTWRYRAGNEEWSTATHNAYLQSFAEEGIIFGASFTFLAAVSGLAALRIRRFSSNGQDTDPTDTDPTDTDPTETDQAAPDAAVDAAVTDDAIIDDTITSDTTGNETPNEENTDLTSPAPLRRLSPMNFAFLAGLASGLVLILLHAFIDFDNRYSAVMFLASLAAGALASQYAKKESDPSPIVLIPTLLVILLLIGSCYTGIRSSTLFGAPLGSYTTYNISIPLAETDKLLNHHSGGKVTPLPGIAIPELEATLVWNPAEPRLAETRMVAKYYAVEVSENQVMHAIVTQKGDPYVPAYLLATAAFSKRAEADIKRGDTAGAATAIAAESKMASAGIKILSANPTWDPGPTMLPQFYAYEIQAVLLTKGCDPVIVPNLLKGQAASLKNAVPSSIKTQVIARQNVARACPNLAKYTALPKQQQ